MTTSPTRLRRAVLLALTALVLAGLSMPQGAAAATAVPDPERNSTAVTTWGWHTSATPSTMTSFINTGYRIIDLEVNSSSPTFTATYVRNSGTYQRSWWWYHGLTASGVSSRLSTNGARLIDIEPYSTSNGTRFAVVMVKNSDAANKAWAYYTNASLTTIGNYAAANNMRVIDSDRIPGSSNFTAVMIRNSGVDAKGWWHYYGVTKAQVSSYLDSNNARLIDLERLGNGSYDVVMQSRGSEGWWWYTGVTAGTVNQLANQHGARVYRAKSYLVSGVRRYDVLMIDDLNSESRRIRNLVYDDMTGKWGFYLKKVGSSELLRLGEDNVFEPASMIKIVHAVRAMRDIQYASPTVSSLYTWYVHPDYDARYPSDPDYRPEGRTNDADVCPYNSSGTLLTSRKYVDKLGSVLIKQTMTYSDNRTTDFLTRRYGFSSLNSLISSAGMTSSKLNHRIGCPGASAPDPPPDGRNRLTLTDAGRIYERVVNGSLLDATHSSILYSYMNGGTVNNGAGGSALKSMVSTEADAAGLTSTQKTSFLNNMVLREKGGSYGYCPASGSCDPWTMQSRTRGGTAWIPFKSSSGIISKVRYVYGSYIDGGHNCSYATVSASACTTFDNTVDGIRLVNVQMFRAEVRKALASW